MSATNRDFRLAAAKARKNPHFSRSYGILLDEGRRILHMHFNYLQSSTTDTLLTKEHYDIVKAIEAMDVELADRLAHEHTRQFHGQFNNFMQADYITDMELDLSQSGS